MHSTSGHAAQPEGPAPLRLERALILTFSAWVVLTTFEFVLYLAALTMFGHLDTPTCAGADTFCSPDGRAGPTGGAIVVWVGNAIALVISVAVLVVARRGRSRSRSTRSA